MRVCVCLIITVNTQKWFKLYFWLIVAFCYFIAVITHIYGRMFQRKWIKLWRHVLLIGFAWLLLFILNVFVPDWGKLSLIVYNFNDTLEKNSSNLSR